MGTAGSQEENRAPESGIFETQGSFDLMDTAKAEEAARQAIAEGRAARREEDYKEALQVAAQEWGGTARDPPSSEAENRQVLEAAAAAQEDPNRFDHAIQMAYDLQRAAEHELSFHGSARPSGF